jgi:pilus assembly protein CpaC
MLLEQKGQFSLSACFGIARFVVASLLIVSTMPALAAPANNPASRDHAATTDDIVIRPLCSDNAGTPQKLGLWAGKSMFLRLSEPASRLTLGHSPDGIVTAKLISEQDLYLVGNRAGSTNMTLHGRRGGRCTIFEIIVRMDPAPLQSAIDEVMPAEKGVVVKTVGDSIVLSGVVSNAVAAQEIEAMARSYAQRHARNLDAIGSHSGGGTSISLSSGSQQRTSASSLVVNTLAVAAPQQVMLEVKVAEVSKTVLDQFGINFSRAYALADGSAMRFLNGLFGGQGLVAGAVSGIPPITTNNGVTFSNGLVGAGSISSTANLNSTSAITAPAGSATVGGGSTTIPMAVGRGATTLGIDAQKQDGLIKVLAEPTVMAISGQEGSFLAGGKIFIPVVQNNGGGAVTYTLEEKEFGVSLRFRPTVLADGRINLQVNPEVSELSATGVTITSSATGATTVLPAFSTRKASTTVQLHDGQSFAIGGLMKSNVTGSVNAFPFLGELPVIGALFRSTSFQTDRSELVFVITPHLVKPLPADFALPTDKYVQPSRGEVLLDGKLEGSQSRKANAAAGGFEPR